MKNEGFRPSIHGGNICWGLCGNIWMFPKIVGFPQIIHFNQFSIIFTIHFGGPPLFLETPKSIFNITEENSGSFCPRIKHDVFFFLADCIFLLIWDPFERKAVERMFFLCATKQSCHWHFWGEFGCTVFVRRQCRLVVKLRKTNLDFYPSHFGSFRIGTYIYINLPTGSPRILG